MKVDLVRIDVENPILDPNPSLPRKDHPVLAALAVQLQA
jgi:hypothetical protein